MQNPEFIIQCLDGLISSNQVHEIKAQLDIDYSHLVGISIADAFCSNQALLEVVKVKGKDVLPERFEAVHVISSTNVAPNQRFYTLFEAVEIKGDEIVVRFSDPRFSNPYPLQIHLLLTNQAEKVQRVVLS